MRSRLLTATVAAAVLSVSAAAATEAAPAAAPKLPRLSELSRYTKFSDSAVAKKASQLQQVLPATSDYQETIPNGETVEIRLSKTYFGTAGDPTAAREWGDFFASLLHGDEISLIQIYVLTSSEISGICGQDALACYGQDQLFTPAEDPATDLSAESVAAHEYGHHIAQHRENPPWSAIDWGPKRWASLEQVCANAGAGRFFPGAEDAGHYMLNPGEGWAETYRVLNEQRLGLTAAPWDIVSELFYPSSAGLAAAQLDVTSPWSGPTTATLSGSVRKTARVRTFSVATPYDGSLALTLRAAKGERVAVDVLASSTRLVHKVGRTLSASTTVCGQRTLRVRVTRVSGAGAFRLTVNRP